MSESRQQLLCLYAWSPGLASRIVGWAFYDGSSDVDPRPGEEDEPPYESVLAAMRAGWRVIKLPATPPPPGAYRPAGYLANEFVLERMVVVGA